MIVVLTSIDEVPLIVYNRKYGICTSEGSAGSRGRKSSGSTDGEMLTRVIFGERARFRRSTCDIVLGAWWMPVFCSGAKQMQASTRKRRTAYLRNASGGIVGKMLNKPPDLRSPDAPSLSRHDARSNINYHHQITISCYIPINLNWNLQGMTQ